MNDGDSPNEETAAEDSVPETDITLELEKTHAGDDDVAADHVEIGQGGAQTVTGERVEITQGGAGRIQAEHVVITQGGVGMLIADKAEFHDGSNAGFAIIKEAKADELKVGFLAAGNVEGDVMAGIEAKTAAIAAVAFAAALFFLKRLFRRRG